jgi:hypothetical protein
MSSDTQRLVLEVTVVENTREEDAEAFRQYFTDMFYGVYDEIECSIDIDTEEVER